MALSIVTSQNLPLFGCDGGDTSMEIKMAKNANAFVLGVSCGYLDEQTLRDHDADVVIHDPSQIRNILHS